LRGHVPLAGCVLEADTPKTQKYENCFRLYSKKLDKSYYLQAADYSEMLQWISAIQEASESIVLTGNFVPAITAKQPRGGDGAMLLGDDDYVTETGTSDRFESMTLTALSRPITVSPTDEPNSERSTLVKDLESSESSSSM
jgi:hypothetical protein